MKHFKTLALLIILAAAWIQPVAAQVYWTNQSPTGVTDDIWCVTYGNGTFAAVTNQGNLLTSDNGLNWTSQAIDSGVWLVSIAYGNGSWVVVGDKGTILESADLKTWKSAQSGTSNRLNGVLYVPSPTIAGQGIFIAVGESGTILTSPDTQNWTSQPSGVTGYLHGITINSFDGAIVVCGQGGVLLAASSANGTGFTRISSPTAQDFEAVLGVSGSFLNNQTTYPQFTTDAVGANGTIVTHSVMPAFGEMGDEFFGGASSGTSANLRGLAYGGGYFVAAGDQGTILSSQDGDIWTARFSGDSPSTLSTATLLSAAYSESLQRFVVTGTGGSILVSNATPTVFANVSTRGVVSSTQTFIGGFVVEGGSPRTVLVRADGPTLNAFNVANPLSDPVLTVFDSKGNAIANNTGWTTNASPTTISNAAQKVGAFALPNPSADSALLISLPPGAYTAQITSAKGGSGNVLFEAYTY
jgi:hypothetical protein